MPLVLKDGAETAGLPTIKLGGKDYFVARQRLRDIIVHTTMGPRIEAVMRKFHHNSDVAAARLKGDAAAAAMEVSDADIEPLITVVWQGLLPLYPSVTRDDLLDDEIDILDLFNALAVIQRQSTSRRASAAGETEATGDPKAPTGERSSPSS
jgi:hypothetical protein